MTSGLLTDQDLLAFARASTTVPNLVVPSEHASITAADTKASVESETSDLSILSFTKIFPEDRNGAAEHMHDSTSAIDVAGDQSDFWNQFIKAEKKKPDGTDGEETESKTEVEEVKRLHSRHFEIIKFFSLSIHVLLPRSESLLPDTFSDPDSFPTSPPPGV